MATVRHVTSSSGLRKFQTDDFCSSECTGLNLHSARKTKVLVLVWCYKARCDREQDLQRYKPSEGCINRLTPNDPYMGRTAPLTSRRCILYIYSTNIGTEYFKHALYSPFFFSSKCSLFHNANLFGSCIIHILYTGCAKIKKKIRRQRVKQWCDNRPGYGCHSKKCELWEQWSSDLADIDCCTLQWFWRL